MELELKHLKGYLGTGLQCHAMGMSTADTEFDDKPIPQVFEIVGLNTVFVEIYEEGRTVTEEMYYSDIFPILRPLSDLIKEIEHKGEKFVPIIELAKLTHIKERHIAEISQSVKGECDGVKYSFGFYNGYFWMKRLRGKKWSDNTVFSQDELFEKLDEWHFDWKYGLIKNGLAIDKNTL